MPDMPAVWDHIYVDQGDSVGDRELNGYVMQVIGTNVELSTDEGERVMIDLELVPFWEVLT